MEDYLSNCNECRFVEASNFADFNKCVAVDGSATGEMAVGIDEAGRGPVLGPMIYSAGVCHISADSSGFFKQLGVFHLLVRPISRLNCSDCDCYVPMYYLRSFEEWPIRRR